MRRQRALAWAIVLALVVAVQIAPLPIRLATPVAAALAQETTAPEAGEPTDLAVVALHCAEPPAAEALAAYFETGVAPEGCAPAVGVAIDVMEGEAALAGSPFQTDVAGSLVVPVGLGSAVEVREDPESLPDGYEPLTGEANGVPYANPVQLDEAVAGAAVLFVNVPSAVAALAQETAPEPGEQTDVEDADTSSVESEPDKTACDLASPEARNFTVQSPSSTELNAAGVATRSAPVAPASGTMVNGANLQPVVSGVSTRAAAPAAHPGNRDVAVASSPVRMSAGVWSRPDRSRSHDWLWRADRDHDRAHDWRVHGQGFWVWSGDSDVDTRTLAISSSSVRIGNGVWSLPFDRDHADDWLRSRRISTDHLSLARSGAGTLAVVSNAVRIGDGVWRWPGRDHADDGRDHGNGPWPWHADRDQVHDWRVNDTGVWVWSNAAARSGNGTLAVSAHSVPIGKGVWFWPLDHDRDADWPWLKRDRFDDWFVHDHGVWRWPGRVDVSHFTAARSGNGSLAIVASAVHIGAGVWRLPPGHIGHGILTSPSRGHDGDWLGSRPIDTGVWVVSTAIARSSSGTLAISSHAVRIDTGVWRLPPDHDHDDHWFGRGGQTRVEGHSGEPQTTEGSLAVESPPGKLEQPSDMDQAAPTSNDALAVESPPTDTIQPASESAGQQPVEAAQPASDGSIAPPADSEVAAAPDAGASDPAIAPAPVEPSVDSGSVEPAPAVESSPDAAAQPPVDTSVPDPAYVAPPVDPGYVAPAVEPAVDQGYVAPEPTYVEPAPVEPSFAEPAVDPGFADPAIAPAPAAPAVEPVYNEPAVAPIAEPAYVEPAPVAPEADPVFADPGVDASFVAPDPGNSGPGFVAPEPVNVDPGGSGPGFGDAGNAAPDPGFADPGNAGSGNADPIAAAPAPDVGRGDGGEEDE